MEFSEELFSFIKSNKEEIKRKISHSGAKIDFEPHWANYFQDFKASFEDKFDNLVTSGKNFYIIFTHYFYTNIFTLHYIVYIVFIKNRYKKMHYADRPRANRGKDGKNFG